MLQLRPLTIVLAVVMAGALAGLFVGMHGTRTTVETRYEAWEARGQLPADSPRLAGATETVPWARLPEVRRGPNAAFVNHLDQLAQPDVAPEPAEGRGERLAATLVDRAERRAFEGAPPLVPHAIDERSSAACLACHGEGLVVADRIAPRMSHPVYSECTQCHVPMDKPMLPPGLTVASTFEPLRSRPGQRAFPEAPPTTPHPTWMRSDCVSCHGDLGPPGLRTTHPERQSCTQCHATEPGEVPGVLGLIPPFDPGGFLQVRTR